MASATATRMINMPTERERALIEGLKQGRDEAFIEFQSIFGPKILSLARFSLGRYREEAEDVSQDVMMSVVKNIKNFDGRASLITWVITITLNVVRDKQRKFKSRRLHLTEPFNSYHESTSIDYGRSPLSLFELSELRDKIANRIEHLKPSHRAVIRLYYLEELSIKEVAARLGMNVDSTKVRALRGRRELMEALAREGIRDFNFYAPALTRHERCYQARI